MTDDHGTLILRLRERIKELECVYDITSIASNPNASYHQIIQDITDRILPAFLHPEHTCARVTIGSRVGQTANFKPCPWKLDASITMDGKVVGTIEVGCIGASTDGGSPFLDEEKKLLQVIAAHIGLIVQSNTLKDSLAQSEKCYRNLVENALVGIIQSNLEGELLYANNTGLRMFGYESLEEAKAERPLCRYRKLEDGKTLLDMLMQTGKVSGFEVEYMTKTGESLFVLFNAVLEENVITGMMMDITNHKRIEKALRSSERGLAEAERTGHLGSWIWNLKEETHHWSDEFYRIFGLEPGEIVATYEAFLAAAHPDDRQAVHQANMEAISDPDKTYSIDYRVVRPDGTERDVHARADVLFDQNRKAERMIGTLYDITERKRAEEALESAFDEIKLLKEQLEAENIYLREEVGLKKGFTEIVGDSDSIKYVMHRIRQVAPTRTTVLLEGETGTGKGLFARLIHEASGCREKSFVNVNCAGLPPNLIESELFGREKGAFTGATVKQIGRFELADGGTIFLDEIAELPLELQAKLLKVIEDGEFERLGSPYAVKVDVRIIASTNRNLEEEISKGRFRKDLFYRLNVFPVTIPPLRQREGDISLLVKFFAERFSKRHGRGVKHFDANTMKTLERYDWPGNVRELMNVIERAVIVSEGPELRLSEQMGTRPKVPVREKVSGDAEERKTKGLVDMEREHISKTLRDTGWRIEGPRGAAEILGMNPSTLRARMRKLGIKRPKSS